MSSKETGPPSYEQARDELAMVVSTLETGGLTLDESLKLWERGQSLATQCTAFLDGARERVQAALEASETAAPPTEPGAGETEADADADPDPDPDRDRDRDRDPRRAADADL